MAETHFITAAMLYDLVQCPHRMTMDLFGDSSKRDPINPFIQLLWDKGNLYEKEVIGKLEQPFLDLSHFGGDEKTQLTLDAMRRGEPLIYGGRIKEDDLLGDPDILRKEESGYIPGDIKSGAGEEGPEDNKKPKKHYGVQLAIYSDILERKDLSAGRRGFIWDIHGEEVPYDLMAPKGTKTPESLWDDYQSILSTAREILSSSGITEPAYSATCKLCHWYSACLENMESTCDLTLIPELGRSIRDKLNEQIKNIPELASADPVAFIKGKKTIIPGLGADRFYKFLSRAKLIHTNGEPYLRKPVTFQDFDKELFFDIECDPMRDICYLHGFIERTGKNNSTERFISFFADLPTPEEEKRVFTEAVQYIQNSQPCSIYYYSKYERTIYRKLWKKYPEVIKPEELEEIFNPFQSVDLYFDVVQKATEWPTRDYSIKTLASYLGFDWRDVHPSGAASIEWFHKWVETGDSKIKLRILEYNEDDCRATRVLLDGIRRLDHKVNT